MNRLKATSGSVANPKKSLSRFCHFTCKTGLAHNLSRHPFGLLLLILSKTFFFTFQCKYYTLIRGYPSIKKISLFNSWKI